MEEIEEGTWYAPDPSFVGFTTRRTEERSPEYLSTEEQPTFFDYPDFPHRTEHEEEFFDPLLETEFLIEQGDMDEDIDVLE